MKVYTCEDRLTDIMTCIYDAWSEALRIGHNQIQLKKGPVFQQTLFDEYIHIDGDASRAEKVIRSIRRSISEEAYLNVYYATLCADEDSLQAIYNFLRVGFAVGSTVLGQYTNPHVMKLLEIRRRVSNEAHHFREFARFQSLDSKVYVSHLEPKNDVIMLVGNHFSDRMPSEHWMIIDDNRKTACVHVKDGENYLRYLMNIQICGRPFFMRSTLNSAGIISAREIFFHSGKGNMQWNLNPEKVNAGHYARHRFINYSSVYSLINARRISTLFSIPSTLMCS